MSSWFLKVVFCRKRVKKKGSGKVMTGEKRDTF